MSWAHSTPDSNPDPSEAFLLAGRWRVRPDINRVFDGETEHQVPDKFMQVLVALASSGGVVSRQELFDKVWPDTIVVDESLTRAISSLRKIFDDDPKDPRIIETIPKKGYRLLVSVEPVDSYADGAVVGVPEDDSSPEPPSAEARRWPMVLAAAIAVASVAGWWTMLHRETRPPREAARTQITALPGIEEYPALSPAGDRVAFVWDGDETEPDGVHVQVIGAGPSLRLTHTEGHYAFPAWTHDSRFIAYARVAGEDRGIHKVPAAGGAEIEVAAASDDEVLTAPTFSPDGRWLVYSRRAAPGQPWEILRMNLETGEIDTLAPTAAIPFSGYRPRFAPDGDRLAFLSLEANDRGLMLTTVEGSSAQPAPAGNRPITDFDWLPDDRGFVISVGGEISTVDPGGSESRILSTTQSFGALSAASDRPVLAYSQGRREKNIWRQGPTAVSGNGDPVRLVHSTTWDALPALSPDGRAIAFLSDRTGRTALWIASGDGTGARMVTDIEGIRWIPPSWSPNGDRIAITVDVDEVPSTCIVEVAGGRTRVLTAHGAGETFPTWTRDGDDLFVTRSTPMGGEIRRRPISGEGEAAETIVVRDGAHRAAEVPDGSALYFTRTRRTREIWRCDPGGGDAEVVFSLDLGEILTWTVTNEGLVVGSRTGIGDRTYRIVFFHFDTRSTTDLFTVPGRLGFELDIDPSNGRTLVYDRTEAIASDIFAVENY